MNEKMNVIILQRIFCKSEIFKSLDKFPALGSFEKSGRVVLKFGSLKIIDIGKDTFFKIKSRRIK